MAERKDMDKKLLKRNLQRQANGASVISRLQLEKFLGLGSEKTASLFEGLEMIEVGQRRKYFIDDVAERILERTIR